MYLIDYLNCALDPTRFSLVDPKTLCTHIIEVKSPEMRSNFIAQVKEGQKQNNLCI
jgi:hypothetical protein